MKKIFLLLVFILTFSELPINSNNFKNSKKSSEKTTDNNNSLLKSQETISKIKWSKLNIKNQNKYFPIWEKYES